MSAYRKCDGQFFQRVFFTIQFCRCQRVLLQPMLREIQCQQVFTGLYRKVRSLLQLFNLLEQRGKSQNNHQAQYTGSIGFGDISQDGLIQFASVAQRQDRQLLLFFLRETGQVSIAQEVGTVPIEMFM